MKYSVQNDQIKKNKLSNVKDVEPSFFEYVCKKANEHFYVYGFDQSLEKLQNAVILTKNPEFIEFFALNVEWSNKKKLLEAYKDCGGEDYVDYFEEKFETLNPTEVDGVVKKIEEQGISR